MSRTAYYNELKALARQKRLEFGLTTPKVTLTDLRRICKAEGITVRKWKGPLKGVRGQYSNDHLGIEIMVNANLPPEQRIITIAHELKHHFAGDEAANQTDEASKEPSEIGAEIFAIELIYPEQDFLADLKGMGVTRENFTAEAIVRLKRQSTTTLSFTCLAKRSEFHGFAEKGSLSKVQWKKMEERMFGEPDYKRIRRYKARRASGS